MPLHRYLAEHLFALLGMTDSDLLRAERLQPHLATGYTRTRSGSKALTDRQGVTAAAGATYSPRPLRRDAGRRRRARHDPGAGGPRRGAGLHQRLDERRILAGRRDAPPARGSPRHRRGPHPHRHPQRPDVWSDLCGWYRPQAQRTDTMARLIMGGGLRVGVRRGRLVLRGLSPLPPMYRGLRLHPADPDDPDVFHVDLSLYVLGIGKIVFSRDPGAHRSPFQPPWRRTSPACARRTSILAASG